jgi:acyl-CoA synthetase (AMP-forming)/AMP-acid ligase II
MYTSGTTGLPKGVVHTHNSVFTGAVAMNSTMDVRYRDRLMMPLPMFHISALIGVVGCILRGTTLISMPNFDPRKIWTLIEQEKVTLCGAVTAILNFMRQAPEFETFNAPDFRYFMQGGSPLPASLVEIFNARNIEVTQGYALTESCTVGTALLNEDALRKIGSAGRPSMFSQLCLRDGEGNRLQQGEGEVLLKGDFLLKEYWNQPDATAEAFEDGWFRTGDIAEIDEDGFVFIKDRLKDMIISGGENIYPAELENVILGHPAVGEVAVIGLPDDKWGEIACAIVVGDAREASEEDIITHCEARLSRFKLPKRVIFVDEIPRNAAGKVLKRVLREQYQ